MDLQLGFSFDDPAPQEAVSASVKVLPAVKPVTDCEAYWWVTRSGLHGDWWRALPDAEREWWQAAHKEALEAVAMGQPMPRPELWEQRRWVPKHPEDPTFSRVAHRNQALRWSMEIGNAYDKGTSVEIYVRPGCEWVLSWAIEWAKVPDEFVTNNVKIV